MHSRLGDLAEINPSLPPSSVASPSAEVSFIPMGDVSESGRWYYRRTAKVGSLKSGFTPFAEGDILFAKITPCMENGKGTHAVGLVNGIGYGSTEFHVLRARNSANPRYLFQLSCYRQLRLKAEASMIGSAGQKRVPASFLAAHEVFAPPCAEQSAIARILDTLDTQIEKTQALIAKLEQVKEGLLHDLLTRGVDENGELRPSAEEAPELYKESALGLIPRGWRLGPIERFLDRVIDYRGKTPAKTPIGIRLITAKNVRLGYVYDEPHEFISPSSFDAWMTRGIPQRGDVLFTTEAPLGNVARIETDEQLAFAQRIIILQANEATDSKFLKFLMLGRPFRHRLFAMGSGSTVEGIQQSTFRRLVIAVPECLHEQSEIAHRMASAESRVESEIVLLRKCQQAKAGLMDDLLTGRIRVTPLLDRETAEAA